MTTQERPRPNEDEVGADAPVHGGEGDPLGEGLEQAEEEASKEDSAS